jgi:hypothetical protein
VWVLALEEIWLWKHARYHFAWIYKKTPLRGCFLLGMGLSSDPVLFGILSRLWRGIRRPPLLTSEKLLPGRDRFGRGIAVETPRTNSFQGRPRKHLRKGGVFLVVKSGRAYT